MKNFFLCIAILFIGIANSAQTPQSFRYQSVARDNSGNILANQSVSFRISILSGSIAGTTLYSETHTGKTTNAFGLVELEIGKGTPVTGTFSLINWASNLSFAKVERDPAGGSAYLTLSTSQLLSVPYALHAKTVETGDNWGDQTVQTDATLWGNGTSGTPLMVADNGITSVKIANGNILTDDLGYGSVNNAKIQDGTITTADMANDIIISSKIVDGTVGNADLADNAVTTLKIADGAVATTDLANSTVTTEKLGNVSVSTEKLQNSAVTAEKLAANAVTETKIATGAVSGAKIAQAGATAGQTLKWNGTTWVPADDKLTLPYSGSVTQSSGFALDITSSASSCIKGTGVVGIIGETNTAAGGNFGMGVSGNAHQTSGNFSGVQGTTNSTTGVGVYGLAYQSSGVTKGVYGESRSPDGYAVHGINYSTTGQAIGVYGDTYSGTGIGVYGSTASTGNGKAIYGLSNSTGYAGYFLGGQVYIDTKLGIGKGAVYLQTCSMEFHQE